MSLDLPLIWAALICVALLAYVLLDGFDLGVGLLFPLARDQAERDRMTNTIAPVWDGNETWLVLGGGGLFAAFPLAYSVLLTAFYPAVIAMLLALVFRGVAFEFRHRAVRHARAWDRAFVLGSAVAAFSQGIMVGAFVQGVAVEDRVYAGGWFDWLTPFSVLTGVALMVGYALLGATWLVLKTTGDLQARMRGLVRPLLIATLGLMALVSLATFLGHDDVRARWLAGGWALVYWLAPVLTAAAGGLVWLEVGRGRELTPYLLSAAIFALAFAGLAASLNPNIIPPGISFREAANAEKSLAFMLVGAGLLLPVILGYTAYTYWIFRGKTSEEGYH